MNFTLATPVEHNGTTYSELTFREAETGDLMAADAFDGQTSKIIAILTSMSGVPMQAFKKIKMREMNKIMVATAALMGEPEAPTTGA